MRQLTSYFHHLAQRWRHRAFGPNRGSEAGDTLVEVLLAVVVVGIAAVGLLTGFATAINASAQHRNLTSLDSSTRIAANEAIADVQQQAQAQAGQPNDPFNCPATPFSPSFANLPTGYHVSYTLTYWNGAGFQSAPCIAYAPQEYTLNVSSSGNNAATQVTTVVSDPAAPPCPNSPNNCAGAPAQLVWIQQPTGGTVGTPITPQPEVAVEDANGNIVSNDFSSVTLQVVTGPGTLSGSCVGAESYGIAQFSSCSLSAPGTYTIQANDSNPGVTSTPQIQIAVSQAPVAKLTFTSAAFSGSATASASLSPNSSTPITVQEQDAFGNAVNATSPVTVSLSSNSAGTYIFNSTKNATTPTGATTVTIPSGQSSVSFYYGDTKAGTPTLTASATGLAPGTQKETINALTTVTKLGFTTSPFTAPAGTSAATAFTIALEDQFGNPITKTTNTTVNLSSNSTGTYIFNKTQGSTSPAGATTVSIPANTTSVTVYYGDTANSPVTGTVITASATGLTSATQTETITTGPTKLVFTTPPRTGNAYTSAIIGPITVQEQTTAGVPTTVGETVTLSSNSSGTYIFNTTFGGTTPTGSTTVSIPAGSSSVSFYYGDTKAGSPTITAAATGLTPATQPETVNVGPVAAFALSTPSAPVAGTSFNETIKAVDAGGNTVTSFGGAGGTMECLTFQGAANSPNGTPPLYPALGTCQSGTSAVTFTNGVGTAAITLYNAQPTTLQATQGAITGSSNSFNVSAGGTAGFSLSTIPQTAGVAFGQSISAADQWGNPTPSYAGTKCLTFSGPSNSPAPTSKAPAYPAQGSCAAGQSSVSFATGIGTPSITLYDAQTTTLTAKSGALTGTSAPFSVAAGSLATLTVANPGSPQTAGTAFNVQMTGTDQWSNGISATLSPTFSNPSNAPNGTRPTYPTSVTFANGSATSSVTLFDAQSTTLKVTSGSISGTSPSFTVIAGPISSLTATSGGGQSATVSTPFTNKLVASLVDNWGNGASGVSVTFTVPSSGASATFAACVSNTATTCTQTTGGNGQATSSTFTANATSGSYTITASANGVNPATFGETNKGNQTITFTSAAPAGAKVGGATYTPTATATSGLAVTITVDSSSSSICSISGGVVSFQAVGTCRLDANQAGNAIWNAAPQVQQSFTVAKGSQTISFTSTAPASATVGGASYTPAATATSGLGVTITVDPLSSSVCSISGGVVTFQAVGTCTLDANQAGNANWNAATQVQQGFAVGKGSQTISFTSTAPANASVGGATYTPTATATSGLAVTITVDASSSGICSISAGAVSFQSVGTCTLDANQAGNANWNAAPQAQQTFTVGKGNQTISFTSTAPAGAKVGGATYTPTATATSGLAVTITVDSSSSSICSISGGAVSFQAVGTCKLDANQAGNAIWNVAPQVQQTFSVAKGTQTVTITSTAPASATVGGATYTATATASSGLTPVTFSSGSVTVCTSGGSNGSVFTFVGAGTCVVDANQVGNANWNAAAQVQQSFTVVKGSQTVSFTSTAPASATVGGASYTPTASATSGLAVTITVDAASASICSISGGVVNFEQVGTCTLDANQAGNASWNAATQVQQSFTVTKGSQTVSFTTTAPANASVGGATYTPTATATSGLTPVITVDSSSSSVCSISGGAVSFQSVGTCRLDANQAGNTNWNAATQVQQSFTVAKGTQTVSFTSTAPAHASVGGATYTPTATATSGLTPVITVDSSSSSVCSISGGAVSFQAVGTCTLDANQAGNATWNAAAQVQQSFSVTVLTITSVAGHTGGHPSFSGTGAIGTTVTVTVCTLNVAYPCTGHSAGTVATSGTPTGSWTTANTSFMLTTGTPYWAYATASGANTSVVFPFVYETGGPAPVNITFANGGTSGKMDTGDTATVTFSEALDPNTICAAWTSTLTTQSVGDAAVTFRASGGSVDQIRVTSATCGTVNFGTPLAASNYASTNSNLTFSGSTITWNPTNNTLTLTIGIQTGGTPRNGVSSGTQQYTAANGVQDLSGAGLSTTQISGTATSGF